MLSNSYQLGVQNLERLGTGEASSDKEDPGKNQLAGLSLPRNQEIPQD